MLPAYERHLIVSYLANAAARLHHRDRAASALAEWVIGGDDGVAFASRRLRSRLDRANIDPEENLSSSDWRAFRRALRDECAEATQPKPDLTARRLRRLSSAASPGRRRASSTNSFRGTGKTTGGTIRPHRPRPPPGASSPAIPRRQTQPEIPRGPRRMLTQDVRLLNVHDTVIQRPHLVPAIRRLDSHSALLRSPRGNVPDGTA